VAPEFHSVVHENAPDKDGVIIDPYTPTVMVEAGPLLLSLGPSWTGVGRGQIPTSWPPAVDGRVTISTTSKLDDC